MNKLYVLCSPREYANITACKQHTDLYLNGVSVRILSQVGPDDIIIVTRTSHNSRLVREAIELGIVKKSQVYFTDEPHSGDPIIFASALKKVWDQGIMHGGWVLVPYSVTEEFERMVNSVTRGRLPIMGNAKETRILLNNKGVNYVGHNQYRNPFYKNEGKHITLRTKGYVVPNRRGAIRAAVEDLLKEYPAGVTVKANLTGNGEGIYVRVQDPDQDFSAILSETVIIEKWMGSKAGEPPIAMSVQFNGWKNACTPGFQIIGKDKDYRGCSSVPVDIEDHDLKKVLAHPVFLRAIQLGAQNLARLVGLQGAGSLDVLVSRDVVVLAPMIDDHSPNKVLSILRENEWASGNDTNWPRQTGDSVLGRQIIEQNKILYQHNHYRTSFVDTRADMSFPQFRQVIQDVQKQMKGWVNMQETAYAYQVPGYCGYMVSGRDISLIQQVHNQVLLACM